MDLIVKRSGPKDLLLEALEKAAGVRSITQIAEESGTDRGKLYDFKNKPGHPLSYETAAALEGWLVENGYLELSEPHAGLREEVLKYNATSECPECGEAIPGRDQGAMWCLICGALLGLECPNCGHVDDLKAKFCKMCATPLTEPARREAERDRNEIDKLGPKKPPPTTGKKKGKIDF